MEREASITLEKLPDPGVCNILEGGDGASADCVPDPSLDTSDPGKGIQPKTSFKVPKELQALGKVAKVAMRVKDVYYVASSAHTDYKRRTTRNTTTTVTRIGAGLAGGEAGSVVGAAIGAPLGPQGAVIGGFIGGVIGGFVSKKGATAAMDAVSDKVGYNMEVRNCDKCGRQFLARAYLGQRSCRECREQ